MYWEAQVTSYTGDCNSAQEQDITVAFCLAFGNTAHDISARTTFYLRTNDKANKGRLIR